MTTPPAWIAHLDMDAFFASVELLRHPGLRGQPVVIGGGRDAQPRLGPDGTMIYARLGQYAGRGVITTATYEARKFGVHSGMGLMKAAQQAPQAILLPTDFDAYRQQSQAFKAAVRQVVPLVEDRGIDEIYIDLTGQVGPRGEGAVDLAHTLKAAVRDATGLSCSLGIAPNKLLAKICSELDKPDGITLLLPDQLAERIWPLPASKVNGIGPKAAARLAALGIHTLGELAAQPVDVLRAHFGDHQGSWLHAVSWGRDDRPVVTRSEPKSISRETTFERDLHVVHDRALLSAILTRLCERLAGDLVRKGYSARTLGVKFRFHDFQRATREHTLPRATQDSDVIRRACRVALKRFEFQKRLRLLGVRATGLVPPGSDGSPQEPRNLALPFGE
ncbi:MAG: DNA polymerase IV [Pseudomonadota bacterium]